VRLIHADYEVIRIRTLSPRKLGRKASEIRTPKNPPPNISQARIEHARRSNLLGQLSSRGAPHGCRVGFATTKAWCQRACYTIISVAIVDRAGNLKPLTGKTGRLLLLGGWPRRLRRQPVVPTRGVDRRVEISGGYRSAVVRSQGCVREMRRARAAHRRAAELERATAGREPDREAVAVTKRPSSARQKPQAIILSR
jgi:hypothetical protein